MTPRLVSPAASSPAARAVMRGNKSLDSKPEVALRSALHRAGLRFRKHARPVGDLRCAADVVFPTERIAGRATTALAAFARVRLEVADAKQRVDIRGLDLGVAQSIRGITDFISENPEGGKRGQALVAAAFDLTFADVRMGRVNDPSRRFPGDVQVLDGPQVVLAAEVRQKHVTLADVVAFARVLSEAGVGNGVVVALHPDQEPLDRDDILADCEAEHGVLMGFIDTAAELIGDALLWTGIRIDTALEALPDAMSRRLEEIEVAAPTLVKWEATMRRASRR